MAKTIAIYAPLSSGLSGQILQSGGIGKQPTWVNASDVVGTRVHLNGGASPEVSAEMYAPLSSGLSGQVLVSNGAGEAPTWVEHEVGTHVFLNGETSSATSAEIYAPLSAGLSGQILVSSGDGNAPTWKESGTEGSMLMSGGAGVAPAWENWTAPALLNSMPTGVTNIWFKKCGTLYIVWGNDAVINNTAQQEKTCGNVGIPSGWTCDIVRSAVIDVDKTTDSVGSCWVDNSGNIHVWGRSSMTRANFNLVFSIRK